jgi:hypothetical protein
VESQRDRDIAEAVIGKDGEDFVRSELGKVLLGRAKLEKEEALYELSKVLPWRRRKIQELQNKVWRADTFEAWLYELITDGRAAEVRLDGNNQE